MKAIPVICFLHLAMTVVAAEEGAASVVTAADPIEWWEDFEAASDQAKQDGRAILLNFTGSDWCVWCFKLRDEVFLQDHFIAFAKEELVLVEIDFPNKKPQSTGLVAQNHALNERFGVTGYPTIILLNSEGAEIGRLKYIEGGPKTFVREIKRMTAADHRERGTASR